MDREGCPTRRARYLNNNQVGANQEKTRPWDRGRFDISGFQPSGRGVTCSQFQTWVLSKVRRMKKSVANPF